MGDTIHLMVSSFCLWCSVKLFADGEVGSRGLKCFFISMFSTSITNRGPISVFLDWVNCTEDTVMLLTRSLTCGEKQTRK